MAKGILRRNLKRSSEGCDRSADGPTSAHTRRPDSPGVTTNPTVAASGEGCVSCRGVDQVGSGNGT